MTNLPLVSVVVPSYNHEKYITKCIESLVNQTYKNFELIVVDDGSSDNSRQILKELQSKYNFELIFQSNAGLSATLNFVLKNKVKGKYFSICASDDYWALNKIELQVDFMERMPTTPMCYGKTHYIDEQNNVLTKYDKCNDVLKGGNLFDDIFTFKLHPPVNYMYKSNIFEEIGFYDATIYAEDYYMNLQVASKYEIGFINQYLGYYRVDDSVEKVIRFDKVADSHLMSIEGYKNHPLYQKAKTTCYLRKFACFAPCKKHKLRALKNAFKAVRFFYYRDFMAAGVKFVLFWK